MDVQVIKAYTDGSCLGNPGVGGFASIIEVDGKHHIVKGYSKSPHETNNGMELKPVKHTLIWMARNRFKDCVLEVFTDSQYLCTCWQHDKYWLMTKERPNSKDWTAVVMLCERYNINLKFNKIPGHSGVDFNERVDKLAREQALTARHVVFGGKNGKR